MSKIDQLVAGYRRHAAIPIKEGITLSERIWFLVYPPEEERRLRSRLAEFEIATRDSGLFWHPIDFNGNFATWLDEFDPDERVASLANPAIVEDYAVPGFQDYLASRISETVNSVPESQVDRTVFAVSGLMELYDFVHVSQVMDSLGKNQRGILLIFFPGERENNTYRFLSARTGWDYLATPITAEP